MWLEGPQKLPSFLQYPFPESVDFSEVLPGTAILQVQVFYLGKDVEHTHTHTRTPS